ncbi:MAG: TonB-dependent receptor [Candidatus Thiodiazotropha sp.]|nr:TonB-dependent receptor [Candidatus Thiodiazotropha sp.]MCM8922157.1 TonB-dependent receptor [Candidatus Thiodiazotropha sp.]
MYPLSSMRLHGFFHKKFAIFRLSLVTFAHPVLSTEDIPVISVTAPGIEQHIDDVQATIEVIDEAKIKAFSGRNLAQVLQQAAGVYVKNSGSNSSVVMRGFSDDHVLLLVDGMRRTGKYGSSELNGIQLEDIERIEIVRGPMSALYGSESMAGVINIVTKKPTQGRSVNATFIGGAVDGGGRETAILKGSVNFATQGKLSNRITYEIKDRNEYEKEADAMTDNLRDENRVFLSYKGNYAFSGTASLNFGVEYARQDDAGVDDTNREIFEEEKRQNYFAEYRQEMERSSLSVNLSYGHSDADVDRGTGETETTDYSQTELNSYLTLFPGDSHITTIGLGGNHQSIDLTALTAKPDRDVYYLLLQNQWELTPQLSLILGVRHDDYSDFGNTTNPRATLSWKSGGWRTRFGYGSAFKAPNFTHLYGHFFRGPYEISGNPDLQPETSKTLEFAVGYRMQAVEMELVLHKSRIEDMITSVTVGGFPPPVEIEYDNVDKAMIEGAEFTLSTEITERISLNGSLEYLDKTDTETDERLTDYARLSAKIGFSTDFGDNTLYLNYRAFDDYYANDENRVPVSSDYSVLDFKFSHRLSREHELFFGVDNLSDKEIPYNMSTFGYPDDPGGRYLYAGYTGRF